MGKTFSTGLLTNGLWQDASNNIGIGGSPSGSYKLEVTGTAKVSSTLLVSGTLTGSAVATFTAAANPLILKSTSATTGYTEYYYNTSTLAGIIGNGGGILTGANNSDFIVRSEADFVVATGGNNRRLTIASTGAATFQTTGNNGIINIGGSVYYSQLETNSTLGGLKIKSIWGGANSGIIQFINGTAENVRMHIADNGNVGIGTSSPNYKFEIGTVTPQFSLASTSATGYNEIYFHRNTTTVIGYIGVGVNSTVTAAGDEFVIQDNISGGNIVLRTNGGSGATQRMRITSGGQVILNNSYNFGSTYGLIFKGVAGGLDCFALSVANDTNNIINFFNASNTYVASIAVNTSTVSYGTGSDYRLKEDLKDFNGLEKVSAIKVYDFKFKKDGDRMEGVIAHELQEVIPYAVTGYKDELDKDGNFKIQNVDYSKLVPILVKAIQEQQALITSLQARLDKAGL